MKVQKIKKCLLGQSNYSKGLLLAQKRENFVKNLLHRIY